MGKINFTEQQINYIITQYLNKKSKNKIAKEFQVSPSVISRILLENKINIRSKKVPPRKQVPEEIQQKIIDNYIQGKGLIAAGKPFGCSQKAVETILKNRGIKKRTYEESKQTQRIYSLNDDFFKTQTPEMAYILGFIAAGGSVSTKENSLSIQLQKQDTELLKKIKDIVQSTRPLDFYTTQQGRDTVKFQVWSAAWKKDLAVYNIVPNKTFTLKPPTFLKQSLYKDYIRGYFDGDGSVYYRNNDYAQCNWEIIGASKEIIVWIREFLATEYGIVNNKILTSTLDSGVIIYKTTYGGKEKLLKIYNTLYYPNCLTLQRKKEKIETILNNFHETLYS